MGQQVVRVNVVDRLDVDGGRRQRGRLPLVLERPHVVRVGAPRLVDQRVPAFREQLPDAGEPWPPFVPTGVTHVTTRCVGQ